MTSVFSLHYNIEFTAPKVDISGAWKLVNADVTTYESPLQSSRSKIATALRTYIILMVALRCIQIISATNLWVSTVSYKKA